MASTKTKTRKSSDNSTLDKEAQDIILKATTKATAIAALPIPVIDMAGTIYIQMDMVDKLAAHYGIESVSKNKLVIGSLLGSLFFKLVSEAVSALPGTEKFERIFGESLIRASLSGFLTTITGEIYLKHFQNGGTIDDIDVDNYINHFKELLQSDRTNLKNIGSYLFESAYKKLSPG